MLESLKRGFLVDVSSLSGVSIVIVIVVLRLSMGNGEILSCGLRLIIFF